MHSDLLFYLSFIYEGKKLCSMRCCVSQWRHLKSLKVTQLFSPSCQTGTFQTLLKRSFIHCCQWFYTRLTVGFIPPQLMALSGAHTLFCGTVMQPEIVGHQGEQTVGLPGSVHVGWYLTLRPHTCGKIPPSLMPFLWDFQHAFYLLCIISSAHSAISLVWLSTVIYLSHRKVYSISFPNREKILTFRTSECYISGVSFLSVQTIK